MPENAVGALFYFLKIHLLNDTHKKSTHFTNKTTVILITVSHSFLVSNPRSPFYWVPELGPELGILTSGTLPHKYLSEG